MRTERKDSFPLTESFPLSPPNTESVGGWVLDFFLASRTVKNQISVVYNHPVYGGLL